MKRRDFISGAAAAGGAALLSGCDKPAASPNAAGSKASHKWSMATTWPDHFPVIGEGADKFAQWVGEMSGGRLEIKVYGANKLVPPMETFDNVRQGNIEMGHAASYYWAGKLPASQFFASVPFGMNAQQMNAWLYSAGGLELWEEVYSGFNLVPMPVGNSGVQMGGWFNKRIDSIEDLKGLIMRIPGLAGKVIEKAGGTAKLYPGGEIYTTLERGVIDATEWVGPFHDFKMGFHKIAKHYYYPGWHEPGTVIELMINRKKWESLDAELQAIVRASAARANVWMLSEFEAKNLQYLRTLVNEHNVKVERFPDDVLSTLRKYTVEVIDELVSKDPVSKKVYEHFESFRKTIDDWAEYSERAYYSLLKG